MSLLKDKMLALHPGLENREPFAVNTGIRVVPKRSHLGRYECIMHK